jgi:membrane-associated PAP2 superfamily phosphatase
LITAILELTDFDLALSKHFYNPQLKQWVYKNHWLLETVIHQGGKYLTETIGIIVFILAVRSFAVKSSFYPHRQAFVFLFIAIIINPIIITSLKNITHIYCPWDLKLFGSTQPYIRLFSAVTENLKVGHCFPAAHAGGGFTFISFYFFLWLVKAEYKYYGLGFGILLGLIFGIAQQLRGAHFLSHDVFSLAICWFSAVILFVIFFGKKQQWF